MFLAVYKNAGLRGRKRMQPTYNTENTEQRAFPPKRKTQIIRCNYRLVRVPARRNDQCFYDSQQSVHSSHDSDSAWPEPWGDTEQHTYTPRIVGPDFNYPN